MNIPAHNEEKYIGKSLQSIRKAEVHIRPASLEIIVVCNRCTDGTALIAEQYGARVLANDEKNLSAIRNTGIRAAEGEIIVTIDADSVMTEHALAEIRQMLGTGRYIGGGANGKYEAWMRAFCKRKYNSDFAREMSRSVAEYLKQYDQKQE